MKKDEKQRKFHESLLRLLYPPSPSNHSISNHDEEDEDVEAPEVEALFTNSWDDLQGLQANDECHSLPSISEANVEEEHGGSEKLTRSQRKRLRKKKLKETASQRRKIIGPMLPDSDNKHTTEIVGNASEASQHNAAVATDDSSGKLDSLPRQSKVKQRRMSKKMSSKLDSSAIEL